MFSLPIRVSACLITLFLTLISGCWSIMLFCSTLQNPLEEEMHVFFFFLRVYIHFLKGNASQLQLYQAAVCTGKQRYAITVPGLWLRAWPKGGKGGAMTSWRPASKGLPFPKTVEIPSAIFPLNGSCLFIQHYCLTDTHSTWRLGNWSQTVWGRDEIFAPVKVLLKHKPDIILSFPHHAVTCFDSRMLRLISPKVNACSGRS